MKTRVCVKCGQDELESDMSLLVKNKFGLCRICDEDLDWEEKNE